MPVQKDASGRRFVEAEAEVPGTPEEVWEAIASGPGISSWFVPASVEQHEGGTVIFHFGPGMDSHATITTWDPPRRYVKESHKGMGPDDPTFATEWLVEAKSGGTCVVRVVHSWFTDKDNWDNQYEDTARGWISFFRILRLYLAHFNGQHGTIIQLMGMSPDSRQLTWSRLTGLLGLEGVAAGERFATSGDSPRLAGVVEDVGPADRPELLLRLDEPTGGLIHLSTLSMGGKTYVAISIFLYGQQAHAASERDEPAWQAWMGKHFPFPQMG